MAESTFARVFRYELLVASDDSKPPVETTYYVSVSSERIAKEKERQSFDSSISDQLIGEAIARAKCSEIFRTQTGVKSWKFTSNPFAMPASSALRFDGGGIVVRERIAAT